MATDSFFQLKAWIKTGVSPRGAHVRRTGGRCETPLSSWKTIQARRRRAFFSPGPARGDPVLDGGLVPHFGAFGWPLQRPLERTQETPDMPRVILHTRQLLDDPSDTGQRPETRAEAVRPRALAQGHLDTPHLCRRQPRLASSGAGAPQRRAPALAPRAIPAQDALAAHSQASGDCPLRLSTRGKQPRGPLPTYFQSAEIPSRCNMSGHASHRTMGRRATSLYYARFSKRLVRPLPRVVRDAAPGHVRFRRARPRPEREGADALLAARVRL